MNIYNFVKVVYSFLFLESFKILIDRSIPFDLLNEMNVYYLNVKKLNFMYLVNAFGCFERIPIQFKTIFMLFCLKMLHYSVVIVEDFRLLYKWVKKADRRMVLKSNLLNARSHNFFHFVNRLSTIFAELIMFLWFRLLVWAVYYLFRLKQPAYRIIIRRPL